MTDTSIDLSKKIELRWLSLVAARVEAAADGLPFFLVGAMARDLLLHHAHGVDAGRQTKDIDFAVHVETWKAFERIRARLLESGDFKEAPNILHRLFFGDLIVDLIPFGSVEKADRTIAWPPDGSTVMNVIGFREALQATVRVALPDKTALSVASLPALAILKLKAWEDRRLKAPGKDAHDLAMILRHYLDAGNAERLHTEAAHLLEQPDFDYETAGAWLLGSDMSKLLAADGKKWIDQLLRREADPNGPLHLAGDIANSSPADTSLIDALRNGLNWAGAKSLT